MMKKVNYPEYGWPGIETYQDERGNYIYDTRQVIAASAHDISNGTFLKRTVGIMSEKIEEASSILDESMKVFQKKFDSYSTMMDKINEKTKRSNSNLRDQVTKIGESFTQLQKKADFSTLEKQVELLERAANALEKLSELEQSGKLKKITESLK